MKTTINFKSRTVWLGIIGFVTSVSFAVWGVIDPTVQLSAPPDTLAQTGLVSLLGVFLKS